MADLIGPNLEELHIALLEFYTQRHMIEQARVTQGKLDYLRTKTYHGSADEQWDQLDADWEDHLFRMRCGLND